MAPFCSIDTKGSTQQAADMSRESAMNGSESDDVSDTDGVPAPVGPKGDDEMDIDHQTPTAAGSQQPGFFSG